MDDEMLEINNRRLEKELAESKTALFDQYFLAALSVPTYMEFNPTPYQMAKKAYDVAVEAIKLRAAHLASNSKP